MTNKPVKGLRIGNYRITPLGIAVLAALLVILIAAIVLVVFHPFGGSPDATVSSVIPDAPVATDGAEGGQMSKRRQKRNAKDDFI